MDQFAKFPNPPVENSPLSPETALKTLISDASAVSNPPSQFLHPPVLSNKYAPVWNRVRSKLRSERFVRRLSLELNLYGTSVSVPGQQGRRESIQRDRRGSRSNSIPGLKERNRDVGGKWFVLRAESRFIRIWNVIITLLLLYTATVVPYRAALYEYEDTLVWFYLDIATNCLFFLDIWVNLFSSYYTKEGDLIVSWSLIAKRYAKTWLFCDLIACFPFSLIDSSDSNYSNLTRLARVPRLYRLFRLSRLFKALKTADGCLSLVQETCMFNHSVERLFTFTVSMLGAVHLATCVWCALPSIEGSEIQSWVSVQGLMDAEPSDVYIAGFYWAFTTLTTVGYGDICPGTMFEKLASLLWMSFGVYFYSFTVSSFTSLVSKIDTKETVLHGKLAVIDEFAKNSKLNPGLKFRLKQALQYSTEKSVFSWSSKHTIFNELPKKLKYDLAMTMHQGSAGKFTFFTEKSHEFVAFTVPFLIPLFVSPEDLVYKKGDYADEIYFLEKGTCALAIRHNNEWVGLRKVNAGSYFGDFEVIAGIPREFSFRAFTECDLLCMSKTIIKEIKSEFPKIFAEMQRISELRNELNQYSVTMFLQSIELPHMPHAVAGKKVSSSELLVRLKTFQSGAAHISVSERDHFPLKTEIATAIDNSKVSLQRMFRQSVAIELLLKNQKEKFVRCRFAHRRSARESSEKGDLIPISEMEDASSADQESIVE